ncbi:FtsQ-type POTRA domain-containing protein [Rhodoplanes serenus]|uniref:Cell division protein FtsQ n=1 Tax=Rhodoplanes serenus TaxID=200615 RepID=A0A3S4FBY7_9BRAD|nr:cell division protein FtsQ/DivIB [Rhodoplanes serenus]MTW15355.1 FtsQ-type POTRA domain-containing protein [Rhodoplanes serenus]VCU10670.1 Cell division protein FtsQ [Rhodoplanes serenus]
MDGGGREFGSLTGRGSPGGSPRARGASPRRRRPSAHRPAGRFATFGPLATIRRQAERLVWALERLRLPRYTGVGATALIFAASIGSGVVLGGHTPVVTAWFADVRDMAANAAGFRIAGVALTGHKHLSRDEVLAIAGITGRSSLLFLDAAEARNRLKANPWVGDATVQKLYPDRVAIDIVERRAFALWQRDGQVHVIAADGTVLEAYLSRGVMALPFVVGTGAERRARDFLALLDRHPDLRDQVRASVLVGERRWNLKLKNGIDIRLPETDVPAALDRLASLERDKKLLSRDITVVDLRLPDRITVRLSDSAAQARDEALKAKRPKPKGGAA